MAVPEMYTRGQPGEDNRGESLVQQHKDRMQQQKETVAMDKLRLLMPQLGDMVRALALAKADWDIDQAVNMLRSFQVAHLDKVNMMNKKRKKIREEMEAYDSGADGDKPGPSGAGQGGSSDADSSSSDSEDGRDERKSKKSKRSSSKKDKKDKKSSKRSKSKRDKDKDKDKKRKKRKHSSSDEEDGDKARQKLTHTEDFGKYGYIRETDAHAKNNEFMLWATEVKGVNIELLGKSEEKELFKEYMEDFNTGTLKHKKYYHLDAWERSEAIKAAAKARGAGTGGKPGSGLDVRADEEAIKRQRMEERRQFQQDRLNEAYNLLKHTDRAKDMREQELLRAEMNLAYKTGDRARAQKLFERLQPDDQKK